MLKTEYLCFIRQDLIQQINIGRCCFLPHPLSFYRVFGRSYAEHVLQTARNAVENRSMPSRW